MYSSEISNVVDLLMSLWNACTSLNETYHSCLSLESLMYDISRVIASKVKVQTTFSKKITFWRRHTDRQFAMRGHIPGSCCYKKLRYHRNSTNRHYYSVIQGH